MIGTHIITRMNLGQSAETTSRLIGSQTVEYERKSKTRSDDRISTTRSIVSEVRPVITPSELSERLGAFEDGVRALLIGPGEHAYEINLPYVNLPEVRPASVLADWTTRPARELAPLPEGLPTPLPKTPLSPEMARQIKDRLSLGDDA
jgi:hypothetical protein